MISTIALERVPAVPWRNGGGTTQELLAWPAAADWQLRVSVARIDSDGPFSAYPGVERWFAVVQGEGVVLRFKTRRVLLSAGSEPIRFEGEHPPRCDLLAGPTQDINLMVRSDAGRGKLTPATPDAEWHSAATWRAVFTMDSAQLQIDDTDAARLSPGTLAWSGDATQQRWRLASSAAPLRAWWLQFSARPT